MNFKFLLLLTTFSIQISTVNPSVKYLGIHISSQYYPGVFYSFLINEQDIHQIEVERFSRLNPQRKFQYFKFRNLTDSANSDPSLDDEMKNSIYKDYQERLKS